MNYTSFIWASYNGCWQLLVGLGVRGVAREPDCQHGERLDEYFKILFSQRIQLLIFDYQPVKFH